MAFTKVYTVFNPTLITSPGGGIYELEFGVEPGIEGAGPSATAGKYHDFRDPIVPSPQMQNDERITLLVKIVSGSFKMSVANDPTLNPLSLAIDDTITITVHNRVSNLVFVGTGTFRVSA